jgi:hypothetical protein
MDVDWRKLEDDLVSASKDATDPIPETGGSLTLNLGNPFALRRLIKECTNEFVDPYAVCPKLLVVTTINEAQI